MKNFYFILFMFFAFYTSAQQMTYVPDDNFEQALIDQGYDTPPLDDNVPTANINIITTLNISYKAISDLTGIEDFTALEELNCQGNLLTVLDLSTNTSLRVLNCSSNNLTSLNIANNNSLEVLNCSGNSLNNLNVSNNIALTDLNCGDGNNFNTIDVSNNTALQKLYCNALNLSNLNISNNTALVELSCAGNNLNNLDLSNNTNLELLNCGGNNLSGIDLSNNTALKSLEISQSSNITHLDLSNNPLIHYLGCSQNNLTSLDLSANTALQTLACSNNHLTNLDLSGNTALSFLKCNSNNLVELNVKNGNNTNFIFFNAINNPDLTCIMVDDAAWSTANWTNIDATAYFSENCDVTYIADSNFEQSLISMGYDTAPADHQVPTSVINTITTLDISNQNISDLTGIEDFTSLQTLNCSNNNLVNLDLSGLTTLISLDCSSNNLTDLNVKNGNNINFTLFNATNNPDLICIIVDDATWSAANWSNIDANMIFSEDCNLTYIADANFEQTLIDLGLDVGTVNNYVLTSNINSLTSLDISNKNIVDLTGIDNFTALQILDCSHNALTGLDLSNISTLISLNCSYNNLTSLNVKNGNNINFTLFNATNNPNLICIFVDDATWSATNWTAIDPNSHFVETQAACDALSISENLMKGLYVYPNPVKENLYVEIQNPSSYSLKIYDMTGKEILSKKYLEPTNTIHTQALEKGIYLIKIRDKNTDKVISVKFIK